MVNMAKKRGELVTTSKQSSVMAEVPDIYGKTTPNVKNRWPCPMSSTLTKDTKSMRPMHTKCIKSIWLARGLAEPMWMKSVILLATELLSFCEVFVHVRIQRWNP